MIPPLKERISGRRPACETSTLPAMADSADALVAAPTSFQAQAYRPTGRLIIPFPRGAPTSGGRLMRQLSTARQALIVGHRGAARLGRNGGISHDVHAGRRIDPHAVNPGSITQIRPDQSSRDRPHRHRPTCWCQSELRSSRQGTVSSQREARTSIRLAGVGRSSISAANCSRSRPGSSAALRQGGGPSISSRRRHTKVMFSRCSDDAALKSGSCALSASAA